MSEFANKMQMQFKKTSLQMTVLLVRIMTGFVLGLVLAIAGQTLMEYKTIMFTFVILAVMALTVRLTREWTLVKVLILDLILVLVGLVLKLYIHMAPRL
jgi:hypothetical protein